ncbi:hypothetical protein [Hoylesella marshii]|uniref:hypothetical protein n=1 Tax=Hoylesella marshii TaxID=189722 RepID=UPI0028D0CD33|nr:hypothetical protein [Hoylesella marshii]
MGGLIPSDRFLVEKSSFHSMDKSAFVSGTDGVCTGKGRQPFSRQTASSDEWKASAANTKDRLTH